MLEQLIMEAAVGGRSRDGLLHVDLVLVLTNVRMRRFALCFDSLYLLRG
jgi:hypothetical protein